MESTDTLKSIRPVISTQIHNVDEDLFTCAPNGELHIAFTIYLMDRLSPSRLGIYRGLLRDDSY